MVSLTTMSARERFTNRNSPGRVSPWERRELITFSQEFGPTLPSYLQFIQNNEGALRLAGCSGLSFNF